MTTVPITATAPTIRTISLHVGQMVAGQMVTSLSTDKYEVEMTGTSIGVDIRKEGKLIKTIPYSNIQGIDYVVEKK